ncbi:MAG: hypothetical protein WCP21_18875, partial [Armatimonadota bacterium]
LAFALSFGLKAHQRGPAADTGGPGAAQSGPPADTGGPGPAQADSAGDSGGGSEANAAPAWQPERIRTAPTSSDTAAQRERCQSQLKSLARACLMYSMDYDETMPRADWAPAIYPYAMHNYELYKCPVVSDAWGYALDSKVLGRPMAFFYQPAQTALLFDTSANVQSAVADTTGMAYRHLLGANVARVDGSVRWYTADGLAH